MPVLSSSKEDMPVKSPVSNFLHISHPASPKQNVGFAACYSPQAAGRSNLLQPPTIRSPLSTYNILSPHSPKTPQFRAPYYNITETGILPQISQSSPRTSRPAVMAYPCYMPESRFYDRHQRDVPVMTKSKKDGATNKQKGHTKSRGGNHGLVGELSYVLERFKIRTVNAGGGVVVKNGDDDEQKL